jgi:hypothetical protein
MSEPKDDGGPAFPLIPGGMPLRDWFAGQALVGLLVSEADLYSAQVQRGVALDGLAEHCYRCADAMLAERRK